MSKINSFKFLDFATSTSVGLSNDIVSGCLHYSYLWSKAQLCIKKGSKHLPLG